jgi:hypothetical protein
MILLFEDFMERGKNSFGPHSKYSDNRCVTLSLDDEVDLNSLWSFADCRNFESTVRPPTPPTWQEGQKKIYETQNTHVACILRSLFLRYKPRISRNTLSRRGSITKTQAVDIFNWDNTNV